MIDRATRREWRRQAGGARESALNEYAPTEFLTLLDAYEELLSQVREYKQREQEQIKRLLGDD